MYKNLAALFAMALIGGTLAGCSGDVRIENPGPTTKSEESSQQPPAPEPEGEPSTTEVVGVPVGAIGDTLNGKATSVTLNSVTFAKPNAFLEPKFGHFIVLNFTVTNLSEEPLAISSMASFELQGSDLYVYSMAFGVETRGSLDSTIEPGGSLRGEIAFDVPEVDSYELRFKDMIFGNYSAKYTFRFSDIGS